MKTIRTGSLVLGTFFNPLGFDAAFALVMSLINSYWGTALIFYFITACLLGLYYYRNNKITLMLAMSFNPFGFDILFAGVMAITGSFWITDIIFYIISGLFYLMYYLLGKIK